MKRIIKVRTIPRGYTPLEDRDFTAMVKTIASRKTPADFFLELYGKFGNPDKEGIFSYMLRRNNVVLKVVAEDRKTMAFMVWVSPQAVLNARRKKTKVMNVIARRLNELDVPFLLDDKEPEGLYFAVRQKNSALMKKKGTWTTKDVLPFMKDGERAALFGGMSMYMPEVVKEVTDLLNDIFK